MLQLKCTQKVQRELGLKLEDTTDARKESSLLGSWYVNLFLVNRRKTFIFMSEKTLLSFIIFGVKKSNVQKMPEVFLRGLDQVLTLEGFSISEVNRVFKGYESPELTKTDSRSLLGNMNDLTCLYKQFILSEGGLNTCNLNGIISQVNRTPQRNLDWLKSIEVVRNVLQECARTTT